MKKFFDKLEEDSSLLLPQTKNVKPHDEIAQYRRFIRVESKHLYQLHRAGYSGLDVCHAQTKVLDILLVHLFRATKQFYFQETGKHPPVVALIALGGYGRQELNPKSDIDLMFLHDGELVPSVFQGTDMHPFMGYISEQILYTLYDIPLKVGHSVQTIGECITLASKDMRSKTALIEARRIDGALSLYTSFKKRVFEECIKNHTKKYLSDRQQDQKLRHQKYGNSPTLLEPDLKNGCGGLRDFHNLVWISFFKFHTTNLDVLKKRGHITQSELAQLNEAHNFLLRVRNELHYLSPRSTDILSKSIQPTVAAHLGFEGTPAMRIEKFMQTLYTHNRNIYLISSMVEQRFALSPENELQPNLTSLISRKSFKIDGVKVENGRIYPPKPDFFKQDSSRLMRLFLLMQQRGLSLHPELFQQIRDQNNLCNSEFRTNTQVRDSFLTILHQRGSVAPILRKMHETNLLGGYIPEFGKLTCLVQHEFFHRYTADEHTLMCIEQLDRIWQAREEPYIKFQNIFQNIESPHILYLALLLHDTGKALPNTKAHADDSATLSSIVAKRMQLSERETELLLFLVKNHLYFYQIATQRDPYDITEIQNVVENVKTPERLNLLFLLTFSDTLGTSETLWTGFKDLLLWSLYKNVLKYLKNPDADIFGDDTLRQFKKFAKNVEVFLDRGVTKDDVTKHLLAINSSYRRAFSPDQIARHITLAKQLLKMPGPLNGEAPDTFKINWEKQLHHACSRVTICAYYAQGVFHKICGALTASGLTILNARRFLRKDGISLDSFQVLNASQSDLPSEKVRKEFQQILKKTLNDRIDLEEAIRAKYRSRKPSYLIVQKDVLSIPTTISWVLNESKDDTILKVQCQDYLGLLYSLTRVLSQLGAEIVSTNSVTEKGAAVDIFRIRDTLWSKIRNPKYMKLIQACLENAIDNIRKETENEIDKHLSNE